MKHTKLLLAVTAWIFLSTSVFAAKDNTTININLLNMTATAATPVLQQVAPSFNEITGGLMQANGGQISWSPVLLDSLYTVGIYSNGSEIGCNIGYYHSIVINPEIYKNDLIFVSFTTDSNNNLVCTCSGSACDVSSH